MTARYVTLGDGRKIGLGAYVRAWKGCLRLDPKTPIGKGIYGLGQTAGEALLDLRDGMDDRINRHDPRFGRGRKWAWDWQRDARNLAWRLNNRIVIDWMRPEFKQRFAHRLREMEDA